MRIATDGGVSIPMADVFISYSKKEPEITVALASILEANGYTTWWDTSLLPGEDFPNKIKEEIQNSKVTIVVWTSNSIHSTWVRAEAYMADAQGKLITVRSPDLNPNFIPLPFNTRHTEIFTDAEKILRALREQMRRLGHVNANSRDNGCDIRPPAPGTLQPPVKIELSPSKKPLWLDQTKRKFNSAITHPRIKPVLRYTLLLTASAPAAALILESAQINSAIVSLLTPDLSGPSLNGQYLFPASSFTATLVVAYLAFVITCGTSFLRHQNKNVSQSEEILGLRQDIDDLVRQMANITSYIYGGDDRRRLNIQHVYDKYMIASNGDTSIETLLEIYCIKPVHFWEHWIESDPESEAVTILRDLNCEITDLDTGQKLDWMPTRNEPKYKILVIFFPEAGPGTTKHLLIRYQWPGYMNKLFKLGATSFYWRYISHDIEKRAKLRKEWIFSPDCPPLKCRITGRQSETAILHMVNSADNLLWIYEDMQAPTDFGNYSVEFLKEGKSSGLKNRMLLANNG